MKEQLVATFPSNKLHQLQHLRIHLSACRRHHCWEFKYDKIHDTWKMQRKLILVRVLMVSRLHKEMRSYISRCWIPILKKKKKKCWSLSDVKFSLFLTVLLNYSAQFCVIFQERCHVGHTVQILLWQNESRSLDIIALVSLIEMEAVKCIPAVLHVTVLHVNLPLEMPTFYCSWLKIFTWLSAHARPSFPACFII